MGQPDRIHLRGKIAPADCLGQRTVDGHQNGADILVRQHHCHAPATAVFGQNLGVPRISVACGGQGRLVDRRGHHAAHRAFARQPDRCDDGAIGHLPADGRNLAHRGQCRKARGCQNIKTCPIQHGITDRGNRPHRYVCAKGGKGVGHDQWVAHHYPAALLRPSHEHSRDDLRPDPRWITHRHGKREVVCWYGGRRECGRCHDLWNSTVAHAGLAI